MRGAEAAKETLGDPDGPNLPAQSPRAGEARVRAAEQPPRGDGAKPGACGDRRGTNAGYNLHQRAGEGSCRPCRTAHTRVEAHRRRRRDLRQPAQAPDGLEPSEARSRLAARLAELRECLDYSRKGAASAADVPRTALLRAERHHDGHVYARDVAALLAVYGVDDWRAWLGPLAVGVRDVAQEIAAAEERLGYAHDPADPFAIVDAYRAAPPSGACTDRGGTAAGHERHRRAGEHPCHPCVEAHREREHYQRLTGPYRWTREQLAEAAEGYTGAPPDGWAELGACLDDDNPDAWFPETHEDIAHAMAVCGDCPVRRECLHHALARGERVGVWGGAVEADRLRLYQEFGVEDEAECGTHKMYQRHRNRGETPCDACRRGHADYKNRWIIGGHVLDRQDPGHAAA